MCFEVNNPLYKKSSPPLVEGDPQEITEDSLLAGRVKYAQPAHGYRVTVEAPLLARFAVDVVLGGWLPEGAASSVGPFEHVVDLASGPGAIALMLLVSGWARRATAVELDPWHAALARENALRNGVELGVVQGSVVKVTTPEPADLVILNPPYFDPDGGALAPEARRANARSLTRATLVDFLALAAQTVSPSGCVVLSFPAARFVETLQALETTGLHARWIRFVHPRPRREAQVFFMAATLGRHATSFGPPLCIRAAGCDYTAEVASALEGRWPQPSATAYRATIEGPPCCHC